MTERTETLVIDVSLPRGRLDIFLHRQFPCVSRNAIQRLIGDGQILVNGDPVKRNHHPRAGEVVTVHWPEPRPTTIEPRDLPLEVMYEDESLLVLNKAAGMVVHPAAGHEDNTLVNALLHYCRGKLSGIGGVQRPGIVHRLDQYTSGLMVVAKTDRAHTALSYQFAHREVSKFYHAVACGRVEPPKGEVDAAIARHPNHRKVMTVLDGGRSALTSYRTLAALHSATLVEVRLHTGRTHQVRVHFKHLGFPLVGDNIYGKRAIVRLKEQTGYEAPRQMLHARSLTFQQPISREEMSFEASWPEDFRQAVRALGGPDDPPTRGAPPSKDRDERLTPPGSSGPRAG